VPALPSAADCRADNDTGLVAEWKNTLIVSPGRVS
jgi:hypothetical protein